MDNDGEIGRDGKIERGDSILDWIDKVAEDNDYYDINDPYVLFSGDKDKLTKDSNKYKNIKKDSTLKDFYKLTDMTFRAPSGQVERWNMRNPRQEFRSGGRTSTVYPSYVDNDLTSSTLIKDAYISIFSIDPSTIVHLEKSQESGRDVTEYRVSPSSKISVVTSARVKQPDVPNPYPKPLPTDESTTKRLTIKNFGTEYKRLYTSKCSTGKRCELDEDNSDGSVTTFTSAVIPEGHQRLTVETKYTTKWKLTTLERDWKCNKNTGELTYTDENGNVQTRPSGTKPAPGTDTDDPDDGWECHWGSWNPTSHRFITDSHIVTDEKGVIGENPHVKARKANLPGGREEYYITNLDKGEWSHITFGKNGKTKDSISSAWRYFASRDKRWDMYCERDGKRDTAADDCPGTAADPKHFDYSGARPLRTHAIPGPYGVSTNGYNVKIRDSTLLSEHDYPYAEKYPTCKKQCNWQFLMYEPINREESSYHGLNTLIVHKWGAVENLRVHGLVKGSAEDIEITHEREVHRAGIEFERLYSGRNIPDEVPSARTDLPDKGEVRVKIKLYDAKTGDPIDLTDRNNEKITLTNGENSYSVKTDEDGIVELNIKDSSKPYEISYNPQKWWALPRDKQAYVSEMPLRKSTDKMEAETAWDILLKIVVLLGMTGVILTTFARTIGISLKMEHILWLLGRD